MLQIAELLLPHAITEKFLRHGLDLGGWVVKRCDDREAASLAAKCSTSWKAFRRSPSFATFRELFKQAEGVSEIARWIEFSPAPSALMADVG